jgi:hypothetical protein
MNFLLFTTSKIHKNVGFYKKSSLIKISTIPQTLLFSPFYSPTNSSNCLTTFDISILVRQFLLLTMSLHFDLSAYLLLCQVALQSIKSIYSNA